MVFLSSFIFFHDGSQPTKLNLVQRNHRVAKCQNYLHTDEIIQTSFLFVHDGMNILNMIAWQRAFKVGDGLVMISSTATRGNSEKCSSLLQWLQERAISGPFSSRTENIYRSRVSGHQRRNMSTCRIQQHFDLAFKDIVEQMPSEYKSQV